MQLRRWLAILTLTALTACGVVGIPPAREPLITTIRNAPARTLVLHADTAFKPIEQVWIKMATDNLWVQTSGLLRVDVIYDLDCISSWKQHEHDSVLLRAPVDAAWVLKSDMPHNFLLGQVDGVDFDHYDPSKPVRVFLVVERMYVSDMFVHVTMHELLHAFGVRHQNDQYAIMYPATVGFHPSTCIDETDAKALCQVEGCTIDQLNYCR